MKNQLNNVYTLFTYPKYTLNNYLNRQIMVSNIFTIRAYDKYVITTTFWYTVYVLCTLLMKSEYKHPKFISRLVSCMNATILLFGSIAYNMNYLSLEWWTLMQAIPVGYCIYDSFLIASTDLFNDSKEMFIHHFAFALCILLGWNKYYNEISTAYIAELTNLFLYPCWFLVTTHKYNEYPRVFKFLTVMLILSFFFTRVLIFPYLTYTGFMLNEYISGTGMLVLSVMNIRWFHKLLNKAISMNR